MNGQRGRQDRFAGVVRPQGCGNNKSMQQPFRLVSAAATLQIGLFVVRFRMRPGFRSPPICHVGQNPRGHPLSQSRSWQPSLLVLQTKYIKDLELHRTQSSLLATLSGNSVHIVLSLSKEQPPRQSPYSIPLLPSHDRTIPPTRPHTGTPTPCPTFPVLHQQPASIVHHSLNFFKANAALIHPCDQVRVQICFCDLLSHLCPNVLALVVAGEDRRPMTEDGVGLQSSVPGHPSFTEAIFEMQRV